MNDLTVTAVCFGVVVAAVLLVTFISLSMRAGDLSDTANEIGSRLVSQFRDRSDYRSYVGMPPEKPTQWVKIVGIGDDTVMLEDSRSIDLSAVTSYFVAYPGGGLLQYGGKYVLALPEWVSPLEPSGELDHDELAADDLRGGQSLMSVTYGKSTLEPDSRDHYSTTLTNHSETRIRVLKFAGYTKTRKRYVLNTVTGEFFTADDFRQWYGQRGEWIEPGQSVTDSHNYGSRPVMWAYYCEREGGTRFVTGAILD